MYAFAEKQCVFADLTHLLNQFSNVIPDTKHLSELKFWNFETKRLMSLADLTPLPSIFLSLNSRYEMSLLKSSPGICPIDTIIKILKQRDSCSLADSTPLSSIFVLLNSRYETSLHKLSPGICPNERSEIVSSSISATSGPSADTFWIATFGRDSKMSGLLTKK